MKKYTTLLCLLLALVMVMACFTGCAKQPAQSDPADTTEPAQTTDTAPEDSSTAEPAETRETVNIRFAQFGNNSAPGKDDRGKAVRHRAGRRRDTGI